MTISLSEVHVLLKQLSIDSAGVRDHHGSAICGGTLSDLVDDVVEGDGGVDTDFHSCYVGTKTGDICFDRDFHSWEDRKWDITTGAEIDVKPGDPETKEGDAELLSVIPTATLGLEALHVRLVEISSATGNCSSTDDVT